MQELQEKRIHLFIPFGRLLKRARTINSIEPPLDSEDIWRSGQQCKVLLAVIIKSGVDLS